MNFHLEFIEWLRNLPAFSEIQKISEVRTIAPDPKNPQEVSVTLDIPLGIPDNRSFGKTQIYEDFNMTVVLSSYGFGVLRAKSEALKKAFNRFRGNLVSDSRASVSVNSCQLVGHNWQNNDESEPIYSIMVFSVRILV